MKYLYVVPILIACLGPALGQEALPRYHSGGGIYMSPINCDWLKGNTAMCVENQSDYSIESIACEGMMEHKLTLPEGRIARGGTAIVDFNAGTFGGAGACNKDIEIKWSNGDKKSFQKDVKNTEAWVVEGPIDPKMAARYNK